MNGGGPYPVALRNRFAGDGLVNDGDALVLGAEWARLSLPGANDKLDFTKYKFGHTISVRNADGVLEFHIWNNTSMANYGACFSLTSTNVLNQGETRNVGDTDGLAVRWDATGPSLMTTANTATFIDFGLNVTRYFRMTASSFQPITDAAADLGAGGGTPKRFNNLYLSAQGFGSDGAAGTPSWSFNSEQTMGFFRRQAGTTTWSVGSTAQWEWQSDNVYMRNSYQLNWLSGAIGSSVEATLGHTTGKGVKVTQPTVSSEVFRLESTATNDDPNYIYTQGRVATTDATQTTIETIAAPASTTIRVESHVVARRTGGASGSAEDGAGYIVVGTYKNVAGTATLIGAVSALYTAESQAAWDATFTVSGGNILLRVTGAASNNVTWHSTTKVSTVGT